MILICTEPMDTFYFRDARSFTAGEANSADFIFPSPLTFFGAIGSAVLESTSGSEMEKFFKKEWIHPKLGKYHPELKDSEMKLKGPFLHIRSKSKSEIFFPPPANLWVNKQFFYEPYFAIPYDKKEWKWDVKIENIRPLKLPKDKGKMKPLDQYISIQDITQYLSGSLRSYRMKPEEEFFQKELKYGHARSRDSLTVEEGFLYTSMHSRFKDELEGDNYFRSGFALIAEGIDTNDIKGKTIFLGGERRKAMIKSCEIDKIIPDQPEVVKKIQETKRFFIYFATPSIFENGWYMQTSEFEGANLVGAAVNKPIHVSGWKISGDGYKGEPRPIEKAVPAGSVYFFEADSWNDEKFIAIYNNYHFGESLSDKYSSAGFGIGLIGSW